MTNRLAAVLFLVGVGLLLGSVLALWLLAPLAGASVTILAAVVMIAVAVRLAGDAWA